MNHDHADLLERFSRGDRRALARLVTLAECGLAPKVPPSPRLAHVVGIAGSGGAGKSTLIGALLKHLRHAGQRVAVLACDPQSPRSGGALLGDRVRVALGADDEGAYFRSLSTRGAAGGISAAVPAVLPWLHAFGFDVVLVETVGIGQDQVAIRDVVDTLVLLVTPGTGDEIQWEKAGVIELADLVVIHKADLPGADRVAAQVRSALTLAPDAPQVPILLVSSANGSGVDALWDQIAAHGAQQRT
jgi:LAO/AO transport system kinase